MPRLAGALAQLEWIPTTGMRPSSPISPASRSRRSKAWVTSPLRRMLSRMASAWWSWRSSTRSMAASGSSSSPARPRRTASTKSSRPRASRPRLASLCFVGLVDSAPHLELQEGVQLSGVELDPNVPVVIRGLEDAVAAAQQHGAGQHELVFIVGVGRRWPTGRDRGPSRLRGGPRSLARDSRCRRSSSSSTVDSWASSAPVAAAIRGIEIGARDRGARAPRPAAVRAVRARPRAPRRTAAGWPHEATGRSRGLRTDPGR